MTAPALRPGLILDVLALAGIELPPDAGDRERVRMRCVLPDHQDGSPSAVVWPRNNTYHCSVCGGYSSRRLVEALGLDWKYVLGAERNSAANPPFSGGFRNTLFLNSVPKRVPRFTPEDARRVLEVARFGYLGEYRPSDAPVYEYLVRRELGDAAEAGLVGILGPEDAPELPDCVRWWPKAGYRFVAPLYCARTAELVSVQARSILHGAKPKVRSPAGSIGSGVVFARESGLAVLRGERSGPVVICEGLTDWCALAPSVNAPVLATPGTGSAHTVIGEWVRGETVLVVLDADGPGSHAARLVGERVAKHGGRALRVSWPAGLDACDVLVREGVHAMAESLEAILAREVRRG